MTQSNEVEVLIRRLDELNSSVGWDAITLICKLQDERDEARDKALEEAANTCGSMGPAYAAAIRALKSKDTTPQQKDEE